MIFNTGERTNWKSKLYKQTAYQFINESAWPICAIARNFFNHWCQLLPADKSFIRRLQSKDDKQHTAAFFELLIFALFRGAAFPITINSVSPDKKTTDFTFHCEQQEVLLECTLAGNALEAVEEKRKKESVLQYLEEVPSFPYYIQVNFKKLSSSSISKKDLLTFLKVVAGANADLDAGQMSADYCYCGQGWGLVINLIRKPAKAHERTLGPIFHSAKMVDNSRVLMTALNDKKPSKYKIDGKPYVICIGMDDITAGEEEFSNVLFGPNYADHLTISEQSNGFFLYKGEPVNTSVSAILFCDRVSVFGLKATTISVWHNPYAAAKLIPGQFPVREIVYHQDRKILRREIKESTNSLLSLLHIDEEKYVDALRFENRKAPSKSSQ